MLLVAILVVPANLGLHTMAKGLLSLLLTFDYFVRSYMLMFFRNGVGDAKKFTPAAEMLGIKPFPPIGMAAKTFPPSSSNAFAFLPFQQAGACIRTSSGGCLVRHAFCD
jgi:hypothetical protein